MLNPYYGLSFSGGKGYWNSPLMFSGAKTPPMTKTGGVWGGHPIPRLKYGQRNTQKPRMPKNNYRGLGARDTGWALTLTRAPGFTPKEKNTQFKQEVISTEETRAKAGMWNPLASFVALPQHADTPNLNPTLAQMYASAESLKKKAGRATDRLLR